MLNQPNKRKIPVFYHIPKNAGTYIISHCINTFLYYRRNFTSWNSLYDSTNVSTIKTINLTNENLIIARIIVGDPNLFIDKNLNIFNKDSKHEFNLEYNKLNTNLIKSLFIFSIIIESNGFGNHDNILNPFDCYDLKKIIILREPFSRLQSLFLYIKSDNSKHELDRKEINVDSFEEYINSHYLEDSWLIRNLINVSNDVCLNEEHFKEVCNILKTFDVYDIKNVNKCIKDAYMLCYNLNMDDEMITRDTLRKNENNYKKIKFEELSSDTQKIFIERTYWDNKIYERFCIKE